MSYEEKDVIHTVHVSFDEATGAFRSASVDKGRFLVHTETGKATFSGPLDPALISEDELHAIFGETTVSAMAQHAEMSAKLRAALEASSAHEAECSARVNRIHAEAMAARDVVTTTAAAVEALLSAVLAPVNERIAEHQAEAAQLVTDQAANAEAKRALDSDTPGRPIMLAAFDAEAQAMGMRAAVHEAGAKRLESVKAGVTVAIDKALKELNDGIGPLVTLIDKIGNESDGDPTNDEAVS